MAIAYFIPDQAKLLAGQRPSRGNTNNSNRSSTNNNQTSTRLPNTEQVNETAPVNSTVNRGYGTTINITVPTLNTTTPQEPLGCWDFLTQVFCHALRFYHESSQLQPTVIQISVNFNSQTAETTTTTNTAATTDTTATRTSGNPQETATAEQNTSATTQQQNQKKFSKSRN